MVLSHDGTAADIQSINSMAGQSFILGGSSDDSNSMEQDDDENCDASESVVGSDTNNNDITAEVRQALKKEDRGVFMWRLFFKIIMIVVAIVLTIATYVQLSRSETRDFTNQFNEASKVALSYTLFKLKALAQSSEALSHSITLYSRTSAPVSGGAGDWPYVTLPSISFREQASHVETISFSKALWTAPIVTNVTKWEGYVRSNKNESDVPISTTIFTYGNASQGQDSKADRKGKISATGAGPFTPIHQVFPPQPSFLSNINGSMINYDISSEVGMNAINSIVQTIHKPVLSRLLPLDLIRESYPESLDSAEPLSLFVMPVYNDDGGDKVVSYIQSLLEWHYLFHDIPVENVFVHVENTCGESFSYIINEENATYIGMGDDYDTKFDGYSISSLLALKYNSKEDIDKEAAAGVCVYTLTIYPTMEFRQAFNSNAGFYTAVVGITMFIMVGSFFAYDHVVQRRNEKVILAAARSTAIVSSLFPSNIRDRLYKDQEEQQEKHRHRGGNLKIFLSDDGNNMSDGIADAQFSSKPLADLFPETTVLFADIVGFTAWSSVREPSHVFVLLETLYAAFDAIARRRRIFKVETIGDCYVAVAGLPEPMKDHAIVMAKFANDILKQIHKLTCKLEVKLGPDTGDLTLRIGLHSGPVTAGVLRGERARFQLFGDTVNTAARMEQAGVKDKIQISQATADYIIAGGRSHWVSKREDKIVAKGKGELVTYWLEVKSNSSGCQSSRSSESGTVSSQRDGEEHNHQDTGTVFPAANGRQSSNLNFEKTVRLIDWNSDVLCRLLQQIMVCRGGSTALIKKIDYSDFDCNAGVLADKNPFDEVKEIIALPPLNKFKTRSAADIEVPKIVEEQLRNYVSRIAAMYNNHQFHNFEHASHVTMSVTKLLSRIVAPSDVLDDYRDLTNKKDLMSTLHDHTYGITSDPLTQFACVFSALIHDVDHSGVPNAQLISENEVLAEKYLSKSVAEQNSIDLAWNLLMLKEYKDLLHTICSTKTEFIRFRQLVVNTVLATDIMDPELKDIRNVRWLKAFADPEESLLVTPTYIQNNMSFRNLKFSLEGQSKLEESTADQVNRKATIVIEHMIQASDVSHTMQHWHIYRKWNERYFMECYDAYMNGRMTTDPSITWYEGELGFYDFYIIPLAKKLKECGVFGVSSYEYLQYATNNRAEWASRGKEIVEEMKERVSSMTGTKQE